MNYAKAIRVLRSLADLPQCELAHRLSVNPSLISKLEAGKRSPSRELLERFAEALGVPLHFIIRLASELNQTEASSPETIQQLSLELTNLLFRRATEQQAMAQSAGGASRGPETNSVGQRRAS